MDILVVEDEVTYLRILSSIFSRAGHRVHEADGGYEAMKILNNHHVDVLVTDQIMRPVSGLELVAKVKKRPDLAHISIIIITGDNSLGTMLESADAQVNGYIVKPFDAAAVLSKLELVISEISISDEDEILPPMEGKRS